MTARERIKYTLKIVLSHCLYYVGLLQIFQAIVMRRKAVVLMYHRVLTGDERRATGSHPALVVDRETFARQMAVLKRRFVVLSIQEFAERMERRIPFPSSSCVITFDDGWQDNFTNALPVLRRHGLPGLVFLPVNYIGSRRLFWQEALTHLLMRALAEVKKHPGGRPRFEGLLGAAGLAQVLDLTEDDPRLPIINAVGTQKRLTRSTVQTLLTALAGELGIRLEDLVGTDGFIDWEQAADMARQDIAFGGHGAEHLLLTQVSSEDAGREIIESKDVIVSRFPNTVPTFSYPNGYFTPEIVEKVKASGYRLAFITRRGFVSCDDDPHLVRRLNIHESVTGTTPLFLARVVGLL